MNFSNTKKLSKLLSLILVVALTATVFTGCFGRKKTDEETEPNININLSETTEAPETTAAPTETEPTVINENMATVLSQLTIRSSPSTDATVVGTLYAGDKVEVNRRETVTGIEWAYIISPESGWICMDFVEMDFEPEPPATESTEPSAGETTPAETEPAETPVNTTSIKGVIAANGLNIRSDASTAGKIKGSYNKGDVVTILEMKDGWGRTNKGWIKMEYVTTSATGSTNNTTTNNDTTTENVNITSNGSTTVQFRGIVTANELNVRASASTTAARVDGYEYGDRVEILEEDGNWGRTNKGWISLSYIYKDGTSGTNTATGTITGNGLNIRNGPGTDYAVVGSYNEGDSVTILEQFTYGGTTWGCTRTGWISMDFVDVDGDDKDTTDDDDEEVVDDETVTGYITADNLHIRSGPGTDYDSVGSLEYGDVVTITEQLKDGKGVTWGKIKNGWISMNYVELD